MDRKTPLYECHISHKGKMVSFAGYLLPVQYETGIATEHMAVRKAAGLFDVSHMGEIIVEGPDALPCLNYLLTNDFTDMATGQVRYSLMCNEDGGVVDDLLVYRLGSDRYMLVVNASNRDKDARWMKARLRGDVKMEDISDTMGQIALQGPMAGEILRRIVGEDPPDHAAGCAREEERAPHIPEKYYTFAENIEISGIPALISKTGYTGEDGFEFYLAPNDSPKLWNLLLEGGKDLDLIPCGLGARDTLRFEASMPLYGCEIDENITPFEASLDFAVKMAKDDFVGKTALLEKSPPVRRRVGLKVLGRGIVRGGEKVFLNGKEVGFATSGTHCPALGSPYAMALIDTSATTPPGTQVEVELRGKLVLAEVASLPFYKS